MAQDDFFELNAYVARAIDKRIGAFFASKITAAADIDPLFKRLLLETERVMRLGGKRLRPTLALVGYRAAGGTDDELALDAALALELLHGFMCVHDDIMDRDYMRHGGLNMSGRYNNSLRTKVKDGAERDHLAQSMSLLGGDLLITFVYEAIFTMDIPAETRLALMRQINETTFFTVGGQQLDVLYPLEGEVSVKRLLKIPYYKTSMYTFVNPLLFGATLAKSGDLGLSKTLKGYGESLGITFQVVDDMLDVFGSTKAIGKSILSDIRENKPTILRHYAFELASPQERSLLNATFGQPGASIHDLRAVRRIMNHNGAHKKTYALAEKYATQAKDTIEPLEVNRPREYRQLVQLADFCLTRDH